MNFNVNERFGASLRSPKLLLITTMSLAVGLGLATRAMADDVVHSFQRGISLGARFNELASVRSELIKSGARVSTSNGLYVAKLYPQSSLARAGVKAGDILVRVGGNAFRRNDSIEDFLGRLEEGTHQIEYHTPIRSRGREVYQKRESDIVLKEGVISPLTVELDDGILNVRASTDRIYISESQVGLIWTAKILRVDYEKFGEEPTDPIGRYLEIAGRPEKVSIVVDEKLVRTKIGDLDLEGNFLYILGGGETAIRLTIAGHSFNLPLLIEAIPVAEGDPKESVIEKLGFPEEQTEIPRLKTVGEWVDGIRYPKESRDSAIHWRYNKYPGAVIVIANGSVSRLLTFSESSFSSPIDGFVPSADQDARELLYEFDRLRQQ